MFRNAIDETALTGQIANQIFPNIDGDSFNGDVSFLSTLRALVQPKLKDGEGVFLYFKEISDCGEDGSEIFRERSCIVPQIGQGKICVTSVKGSDRNNDKIFEHCRASLCEKFPKYKRIERLTTFYEVAFRADCYINEEDRNVAIFVEKMDDQRMHFLQPSILAFLPWYFNPADGANELEMELLYSLKEKTKDKYIACINKFAKLYDFRTASIKHMLGDFGSRYERMALRESEQRVVSIDRDIDSYNQRISDLLRQKDDEMYKLIGAKERVRRGETNTEIMDYFMCNKKLYVEGSNESFVRFAVRDQLTYFDSDMAERIIDNCNSFVYYNASNAIMSEDDMKELLTEIFVSDEPRIKLNVCAAYSLDLRGGVSTQSEHNFRTLGFDDCMPNIHIDQYQCMGGYKQEVNRAMQKGDFIGALEQCVASCKSLNWGDSTVMESFMRVMWSPSGIDHRTNKCLELPDGTVTTPAEAVKWLKEQA